MTSENLLEFLSQSGGFVSGEKIAEQLKVSRNCVWKCVKELRKQGYNIESVPNKGYRLVDTGNNFSAAVISGLLNKKADIQCLSSVTSTNAVLKEAYAKGEADEFSVVIADRQTEGRGRRGKSFFSPPGSGLYMSILLKPRFKATEAYLITAAAAVAVCRAIEKCNLKVKPEIKWVNDVYISGKKVCGILTEASVDFESGNPEYAILGIGINLFTDKNDFPQELENIAGSVFDQKISDNLRNNFAAAVLNEFFDIYDDKETKFIEEYKARSLLTGKRVTSLMGDGTVEGITDRAELILKKDDGEIVLLSAGEVSVKEKK